MSDFEQRYRTWHTLLSYVKSGIRIFTSIFVIIAMCFYHEQSDLIFLLGFLAGGYGIAELVGIAEEL